MESSLLTVEDVAARLSVKPDTVRRWLRQGRLRGVLPGGRRLGYRVPIAELERFAPTVSALEVQPSAQAVSNVDQPAVLKAALASLREELLAADRQLLAEVVKSLPRTASLSIQDRAQIVRALQAAEAHATASHRQLVELQRQVVELVEAVRLLRDALPGARVESPGAAAPPITNRPPDAMGSESVNQRA
jgi:excisionase family DNA binding protein